MYHHTDGDLHILNLFRQNMGVGDWEFLCDLMHITNDVKLDTIKAVKFIAKFNIAVLIIKHGKPKVLNINSKDRINVSSMNRW